MSKALRGEVKSLGIGVTVVEPGSFRTAFAGSAMETRTAFAPDYADTVGFIVGRVKGAEGMQPGDPAKAATAIVSALDTDTPPRQLLLGTDAVNGVRDELEAELAEVTTWADAGSSTSF